MQDQFRYDEFSLSQDARTVSFVYTVIHAGERHLFTETLEFPQPLSSGPEQLRSLRALHVALGVSYYKTFLPPLIVHPYAMDEAEADFWNDMWQNGLGEFLYVNELPVERLARFTAQEGQRFSGNTDTAPEGALLGIGGGKDSIVAGELLKALDMPVTGFVMATGEQLGQTASVAEVMGVELLAVRRVLDKNFLDLQQQPGAYRGHVPISVIFSLVGTALAVAQGARYVVVANEASASLPGIVWGEQTVNHQWSKSLSAERSLQEFTHQSITSAVTYFSAIRQLSSIGVAKLFAEQQDYFEKFTSDNYVFRIDPARRPSGRWSLESPKSLSSYILLAPWLSDEDVKRIFTIDFLHEPSLGQLFLELTGVEGEPPLDCVGTVDELVLSMNLLAGAGRYNDTVLMKLAQERGVIREADWQAELARHLALQPDQTLPTELAEPIAQYFQERVNS